MVRIHCGKDLVWWEVEKQGVYAKGIGDEFDNESWQLKDYLPHFSNSVKTGTYITVLISIFALGNMLFVSYFI